VREEALKVASEPRSWLRGPHSAAIWLGAYFLYQTLVPLVKLPLQPSPGLLMLVRVLTVVVYMSLALAMLAAQASHLRTIRRAAVAIALGLLLWQGLDGWFGARDPQRIRVVDSNRGSRLYPLSPGEAITLGGKDAPEGGLRYPIAGMSHPVAILRRSDKGFRLEPAADAAGSAPVMLNGKPVSGATKIEPGDVIQIKIAAAKESTAAAELQMIFSFPLRHPFPATSWLRSFLMSLMDIGRAVAAAGIGALIATLIRDPNILLPASVFAAFADYLMVYTSIGTVHQALQTTQGQHHIASMSAPVPTVHPSIPTLTVGMADYVFLAFFFACVYRFGMNERATFVAFLTLLSLSLLFVPYVSAIPALAPMALAFLAINFRHFRLSKSELQAMGLAFAIVAAVVAGLFLFVRQ
jgi:hypothetical protein